MDEHDSVKTCPKCGNPNMVRLRTCQLKYCLECPGPTENRKIHWPLEENQKPVGYNIDPELAKKK